MVELGQKSETYRKISELDVKKFAEISGDHNPIHLDKEVASRSFFGRRIVHGMFGASLISSVISNDLPGKGSIYISQNLNFLKPIYVGDLVGTSVEVTGIHGRKIVLKTTCSVNGENVIEGEAVVTVLEDRYEN